MRSTLSITLAAVVSLFCLHAKAGVEVVLETKTYHIPGKTARVEVNMAFLAGTMVPVKDQRGFSLTQVEALTLIEQNGQITTYAKTVVTGEPRKDSLQVDMLHQEFFDLLPGEYELSVEIRDLNSMDTSVTRYYAPLVVGALGREVTVADILFAERIEKAMEGTPSKYGYTVVPLLTDYLPGAISQLSFYSEIYNTDVAFGKDSLYLLSYQIETYETQQVFGQFKKIIRAAARPVEPVIGEFDIAQLPSGNYLLAIEVRNRAGVLMARKDNFFQRNNKIEMNYDLAALDQLELEHTFVSAYTDNDTLAEYISSLHPIADPLERKIIDDRWKDRDRDLMQRFFYSFWANRSAAPEIAWLTYHKEVVKVNKLYGCRNMRGYQTDRGYVYLKYGPPNTQMDRFQELDAYPYTVWHYYRAGRYSNKRFIFYQPDLVSNCFQLLHSEVPGELKNPRWNQILHQRNVASPNVDPRQVGSQSGERADEFFNMPR